MRTQRLELRLTDEERSYGEAAATAVGESLSDFFRRAAANRAAEVLTDQRRIALTEDEASRFLDALEAIDDQTVVRLVRAAVEEVTSPPAITERYDPSRHDTSAFESGSEALDRRLVRYAGQSERRDASRTFVVTDGGAVIGYSALLAGELDHGGATEQARKGMSRHYPIPVAILARLAVDQRHQHRGLGPVLLRDALERVVLASEQLALRAVVIHAVDRRAARFYEQFGFRALSSRPRTLMVTLAELRAAGYP